MGIKPIDEIPMGIVDKRRSYREQIRNDIEEAIEKNISQFEFTGDYNWKYLAQYAREEADGIWRKKWTSIMIDAKKKYNLPDHLRMPDYHDKNKYIRISSVKMEDRQHVYCKIDFEAPEQICGKKIKELLEEKERKEHPPKVTLESDIGDLNLSVRAYHVLRRARINKVNDLRGKTMDDLIKIRNMGRKTAEEILATMERAELLEADDNG